MTRNAPRNHKRKIVIQFDDFINTSNLVGIEDSFDIVVPEYEYVPDGPIINKHKSVLYAEIPFSKSLKPTTQRVKPQILFNANYLKLKLKSFNHIYIEPIKEGFILTGMGETKEILHLKGVDN